MNIPHNKLLFIVIFSCFFMLSLAAFLELNRQSKTMHSRITILQEENDYLKTQLHNVYKQHKEEQLENTYGYEKKLLENEELSIETKIKIINILHD